MCKTGFIFPISFSFYLPPPPPQYSSFFLLLRSYSLILKKVGGEAELVFSESKANLSSEEAGPLVGLQAQHHLGRHLCRYFCFSCLPWIAGGAAATSLLKCQDEPVDIILGAGDSSSNIPLIFFILNVLLNVAIAIS
jgi:hypothetical protein